MISYKIFRGNSKLLENEKYKGTILDYIYYNIYRFVEDNEYRLINVQFEDSVIKSLKRIEANNYSLEIYALVTYSTC